MEKNYQGNFFRFLINGGFFGIGGMPIGAMLSYYSVMTMFVTALGFGSMSIALINGIVYLGFALPQVPAAYFLESKRIKKYWVGLLQLAASFCMFSFGLLLFALEGKNSLLIMILFIAFYSIGNIIYGCAMPSQFALFNKIVPANKLGSLLGIMFVSNSIAGIVGGMVVKAAFQRWPVNNTDPDFSLTAFKFLFVSAFFLMLMATLSLISIKEEEGEPVEKKESFAKYVLGIAVYLKRDPNLIKFFIGKNLMFGQFVTKLFYVTYAVVQLGVNPENAGTFISCFLFGFFVSGLTLAKLADRYGPKFLLVLSQALALTGVLGAIFPSAAAVVVTPVFTFGYAFLNIILGPFDIHLILEPGYHTVFYAVFFFGGLSQICDNVGYSNMAFQSCPIDDKTTFIGFVNLFTFIMPVIMPFVFGWFEAAGYVSIRAIFIINAFVMIVAMLWITFMVDNPEGFKKLKKSE